MLTLLSGAVVHPYAYISHTRTNRALEKGYI